MSWKKSTATPIENIGDELLWVSSMPCQLGEDSSIPVGRIREHPILAA